MVAYGLRVMNDQSLHNLLIDMSAKLGRIEARLDAAADSRAHIRNELTEIREITERNKTAINLAKGGLGLATFASGCTALLIYMGGIFDGGSELPVTASYPEPHPFANSIGLTDR